MGIFDKLKVRKSAKICYGCGTKLGSEDLYCPKCGKKYEETIVCPHCNASVSKGSNFCTKCGNPLTADGVAYDEIDYSQQFDFYAKEITEAGDLRGDFQLNGKILKGIITKKTMEHFGWNAYKMIGVPIQCGIFKRLSKDGKENPVFLLRVKKTNSPYKRQQSIPDETFSFTVTDVSKKNSLIGRVIVNGRDYKGIVQNSDLPTGILPNDFIGKTFSVVIKSTLQDKVAGEPFYPVLINEPISIVKDDVIDNSGDKFVSDDSIPCEEKIQKALKALEQDGCLYFQNINLNQRKNLEDVIQSLPFENRDYALRIYTKVKNGVDVRKIIESVKEDGILYLKKENRLNTFLAALYLEINDFDSIKECLRKGVYNNFGFYFASSIQDEELRMEFAKKHLIFDRFLPHMDHTVIFVGVCEFLRENDYSFLRKIEKPNDKESYSAVLKFLLKANSLSYESTVGLSKYEEFLYLYRIACEKFLGEYQVEKKKIIFNSDLSSETYMFKPDDVSQLGASLGKVRVNGIEYKGSIQKSDLPQGKSAWQLIGSKFPVCLKGDLQTGQPGGDYYKLVPKGFSSYNPDISTAQNFPLYAKAHELKFKKNNPSEAKVYYIKSINDEKEKQKIVSSVPDLVSIFIQEGNYTDALSYLTQYKTDIRPQAYDSFMNIIAIKQGKQSDYTPTTKTEFPLYDLAHQTLFDFRQRDEAIVQYREAINAGQNVGTAVAELNTVLIQIREFDECAELLAKYGKDMKPTAYENQKKQVLSFRPDLEAKILGKKQLIENQNLKMAVEACNAKDFDKAIRYYEESISAKEDLNQAVPELIQLYLKFGMESMAESIYTDYQKEIEEEKRKVVLKGFYEYYSKINNGIKKEEIRNIYFSIFNEKIYDNDLSEISNSELEYSDNSLDYFKEIIISCSLPMDKLKGTYSESSAIDLHERYENFLFKCSEEDLTGNQDRIRNYLPKDKVVMMLKMIKGFINSKRNSLSNKDVKMYVNALVNLIMYFGDNPQNSLNYDYSRYCYKKILSLFSDNSKQLSKLWPVAILRYFETYNNTHVLSEIIEKSDSGIKEKLNSLEKLLNSIQNADTIDAVDFFVSCISILECINKYKTCVLENFYKSNFNVLLCSQLKIFNNLSKNEEIVEFESFRKEWQKAEDKYLADRCDFINCIKHLLNVAKDQSQLSIFQTELRKIEEHYFGRLLCYQDKQYFTQLLSLLKLLNDFYSDDIFEQQRTNLEYVVKQTKILIKAIRDLPTEIFYDSLLSDIEGFEFALSKIVEAFFQNGKPELDFIIVDDAIEDFDESHNRVLRIPIKVKNKENVQNALNMNVIIKEDSSSFEYNPDWINGQNILAGKSIDNEILFEFPESFDISSDIQFKISYTFEYFQDFETVRSFSGERLLPPVSIKKNDPFILREGQNPYEEYEGGRKTVDKESMFFGRDELLRKIQDRIENRKTKWICLYGQMRTGKTSIIIHSKKRLSQNEKNITIDINIDQIDTIQGFFFQILTKLNKEITEKRHPDLKKKMVADGIELNSLGVYKNMEKVPFEIAVTLFTDIIHDFISYVEMIDPDYKVVLFIDEFTRIYDNIRSGVFPEALMHWWKRFIEDENMIAVTIGQDHMPGFIANPIYNNDFAILSPEDQIIVTTIDSEASKRLIQEPIPLDFNKKPGDDNSRFDKDAIASLQKLTSGSAYLTMTLCSDLAKYLISKKRSKVHSGDISILIDDIELKKPISIFATYFSPLFEDRRFDKSKWSAHKEKNIEIMKKIAVYTASTEYMPRDKFPEEDQEFIAYLVSRGVLEEKGGKVKIMVELCQKWLYLHKEDVIFYETKE